MKGGVGENGNKRSVCLSGKTDKIKKSLGREAESRLKLKPFNGVHRYESGNENER